MYFSCFVTLAAKYPSGKKVISAISLAIIIEPIKVITISSKNSERRFPASNTSFLARIVKNLMFLKAQTTAKVRKRQDSVLKSKYSIYALSGGTKKQVTNAATAAMQNTRFFLINLKAFKLSPDQYFFELVNYITNQKQCQ